MAILDASTAHFVLEGENFEAKDLMIADFTGREAISQTFRFDMRLVSTDREIPFEDLINKPAVLTLVREEVEEKYRGVIVDFSQGGFADRKRVFYHAVLVPRFWLLSLSYQSRVFQNMSVKDIVSDVLKKDGFASDDVKWSLKRTSPVREYVVQYRETDLDFVCRLMEQEGIFFYFDHMGEKDVLTISDDPGSFPVLESPDEIPFRAPMSMAGNVPEHVDAFVLRERLVTGKVMLRDYNYRTPELNLQAESQLNRDGIGVYYEYGDHFKNMDEGSQLARVRNEEIECMRVVGRGRSDVRGFRAGTRFTLTEHFRDEWNQEYLLTEVEHQGTQAEALNLGKATETSGYRNDFTCIPTSASYRPPRITPQPRLPGVWTARIESAGGPYAHLDDQGRYRVRMPFDVGDASKAGASKPVRMTAPYAGPGYGFHAPCHEGVEMVVACVDGDVDRPLGLGVAPNPSQMTPSTSRNKAQTVWRTATGNEMHMDDSSGAMEMFLNASKDMTTVVANDQKLDVSANQTVKIGGNVDESIGGNMTLVVGGDSTETVDGNVTLSIIGSDVESIQGSQIINITGSKTETIGGAATETVASSKMITVGGALAIQSSALSLVCAALTMAAGGSLKLNVSGGSKENVSSAKSTTVGGGYKVTAGGPIKLKGSSIQEEAGANIVLKAMKISLQAAGKIELKAGGSMIEIGPAGVSIKSPALVQIQGSLVKIN